MMFGSLEKKLVFCKSAGGILLEFTLLAYFRLMDDFGFILHIYMCCFYIMCYII